MDKKNTSFIKDSNSGMVLNVSDQEFNRFQQTRDQANQTKNLEAKVCALESQFSEIRSFICDNFGKDNQSNIHFNSDKYRA